MIYLPSTDTVSYSVNKKTVWREQKGSGSCSYILHKKIVHKHEMNNEKWNTYTLASRNCADTNKNSYYELTADKP